MAKYSFNDYVNGAMVIVGVLALAKNIKDAYDAKVDDDNHTVAERWGRDATARFNSMLEYAHKHNISKTGYVEMLGAARNRIICEAYDLGVNRHVKDHCDHLVQQIDELIKKNEA